MSITQEKKQEVINEFARKEGDTGSVEVQCAIMTTRINNLTEHMKVNKKDFHSRIGLLRLVGRRRRLLDYLKRTNFDSYADLIKKLNIRK